MTIGLGSVSCPHSDRWLNPVSCPRSKQEQAQLVKWKETTDLPRIRRKRNSSSLMLQYPLDHLTMKTQLSTLLERKTKTKLERQQWDQIKIRAPELSSSPESDREAVQSLWSSLLSKTPLKMHSSKKLNMQLPHGLTIWFLISMWKNFNTCPQSTLIHKLREYLCPTSTKLATMQIFINRWVIKMSCLLIRSSTQQLKIIKYAMQCGILLVKLTENASYW